MNFMRRHKKAVSPVIAVVLLIALTAAAVGVVWVLFQSLSGSGAVITVTSTTHTYVVDSVKSQVNYTWTGTIKSTSDATITSASWGSSLTNSSLSISLTGGSEKVITISFTSTGTTPKSGSDILSLTVNVGGNDQIVKSESFQWNL